MTKVDMVYEKGGIIMIVRKPEVVVQHVLQYQIFDPEQNLSLTEFLLKEYLAPVDYYNKVTEPLLLSKTN